MEGLRPSVGELDFTRETNFPPFGMFADQIGRDVFRRFDERFECVSFDIQSRNSGREDEIAPLSGVEAGLDDIAHWPLRSASRHH